MTQPRNSYDDNTALISTILEFRASLIDPAIRIVDVFNDRHSPATIAVIEFRDVEYSFDVTNSL